MHDPAPRVALAFLIAAGTCLVGGVGMGIQMGLAHDFTLAPVHAHVNLVGWTLLALIGLTNRAWPALAANRTLAVAQFALSAGGGIVFPLGIWLALTGGPIGPAVGGSLLWLAGAVLFGVRLVLLAARPAA